MALAGKMSSYQTTVVGEIVSTLLICILLLTSAPCVSSQSMTVHNALLFLCRFMY